MIATNHRVIRHDIALYAKHPITGQDANVVDHLEKHKYTWRELFMFQRMIKQGTRFYWCDLSLNGHYDRIDYEAAKPVLERGGRHVVIHKG